MKIAMIGQKGIPAIFGGVERHVQELATRLVKHNLEVTVYCRKHYSQKQLKTFGKIKLRYTPYIKTKQLEAITHTFFSTLHAIRENFDIIHFHGVGPSLLSFLPRILAPQTKVITTFHSMDRKQKKWGLFARFFLKIGEWTALNFAHKTIVVSNVMASYINLKYDKNATCIPNGVPDLKKATTFNHILKNWGLLPNSYIITVARLIPDKGIHNIISAFQELQKNNKLFKHKKLVIVGGDGGVENYEFALKKQANGDKNIIFTGNQTGEMLRELFSGACLFISASINEGLPITVLEAMSYEIPVLVSDIPAHKELIPHKNFLFKTENTISLAKAMKTIVKNLKQKTTNEIVAKNKSSVQKNYNWDKLVPEIVEIYQKETSIKNELAFENS